MKCDKLCECDCKVSTYTYDTNIIMLDIQIK